MDTLEFLNNQWVNKKEPFRQYPSFAESFNDNAYVLRNTSFGNRLLLCRYFGRATRNPIQMRQLV